MTGSLSLLVHGGSKTGKTHFADTAPAPRLHLDAEGGTRFLHSRTIGWDPHQYAPPENDGSWDTCVVYVRRYETMTRVYQWLESGQHPFKSVTLDSISEVQQRCVDELAGTDSMKQQQWGELLRKMSELVRKFRDLTFHPTTPLEAVILVAMSRQIDGRWVPYVQGQLATTLPFYIDVIGYFYVQVVTDNETGHERTVRRMLVSPHPQYEAGDRTGRLGEVLTAPNMSEILKVCFPNQGVSSAQ
jgi:hypothetical protein